MLLDLRSALERQQIRKTLVASWRVRAAVGLAGFLTWEVRAAVGLARSLSWRVRAAIGKAQVASWRVRAAVGRSQALTWRVKAAVGRLVALTWRVRAVVRGTVVLRWAVQGVRKTLTAAWTVTGQVFSGGISRRRVTVRRIPPAIPLVRTGERIAVQAEFELRWAIRASASVVLRSTWRVRRGSGLKLRASWRLEDQWSANRNLLLSEIDEDLLLVGSGRGGRR